MINNLCGLCKQQCQSSKYKYCPDFLGAAEKTRLFHTHNSTFIQTLGQFSKYSKSTDKLLGDGRKAENTKKTPADTGRTIFIKQITVTRL